MQRRSRRRARAAGNHNRIIPALIILIGVLVAFSAIIAVSYVSLRGILPNSAPLYTLYKVLSKRQQRQHYRNHTRQYEPDLLPCKRHHAADRAKDLRLPLLHNIHARRNLRVQHSLQQHRLHSVVSGGRIAIHSFKLQHRAENWCVRCVPRRQNRAEHVYQRSAKRHFHRKLPGCNLPNTQQ